MKFRVFWDVVLCNHIEVEVHTASIIRVITLVMEAVCTSETLVHFNMTTWHYIPGDSKLQIGNHFRLRFRQT
jgi:hypothetical protein